ncbi:MAG: MoaD/ThiS family protein [Anaerolineaceae bacterium]|nr:MoaD/ThiS family protein [Anaerolineaceae bacterium]
MKIKVYAPNFCDHSSLDNSNYMELPDQATVKDIYQRLKIPLIFCPIVVCAVNQKTTKISGKLKDGDVISFILPIAGG